MDNQKIYKAVNWDRPENDYNQMFWEQNIKQFWIDTEYTPSRDVNSWSTLPEEMKKAYMKALGGLTLLDTLQSHTGMPKILEHVEGLQAKSVLSFMCMMESIHAKSYSTIFTTVATTEEIDETFDWVKKNLYLQKKASIIDGFYCGIKSDDDISLYRGLCGSVLLESFLFYSGFFLPLYLAGHGKMTASADIIKKIVADESIHGVYVGLLAQEVYTRLSEDQKIDVKDYLYHTLHVLLENESKYTEEVYSEVGLAQEVKEYVKYNANKALMNLGFEELFEEVEVNPIVLNGLNTETTQHDFFSKKSTNYEKPLEIVPLRSEDFEFDWLK